MRAPASRTSRIASSWRGRSSITTVTSPMPMPLRSATSLSVSASGRSSDEQVGDLLAAGDLLHVDARARVEHRAALGERDDGERARHPERRQPRALERVDRDVDLRRRAVADLLAVVEHRRLVLLALADHDEAVHRDRVEHEAHRVDGGLVGGLLVAAADQPGGGERRGLGDAHQLEGEVAIGSGRAHRGRARYQRALPKRLRQTLRRMELRRLHPDPGLLDSAELLRDLGLRARAHAERPWVVTNFATTADGRAALDGRSGPIGDDGDKEIFRRLRTQVDALLVGTNTLRVERYGTVVRQPELRAAREALGLAPDPLLATVSRSGELPLEIPLFADPDARVVVFTTSAAPAPDCAAQVELVALDPAELTLTSALRRLRADHGVRALLCEGGPTLMGALLGERLVDELFLTLAPQLAGGGTAPTLAMGAGLPDPMQLELVWALERAGSLYLRYALR